MAADSIVESVKETVKAKVGLVKAHAPEVMKTGVETLKAAKGVVDGAREELKKTLKDGADRIGHQIANLASMNHKEQAAVRKEAVKMKKRAKRAEAKLAEVQQAAQAGETTPASPASS